MLQQLLELLNGLNLNIVSVYSDNNFVYHDGISPEILQTGKKNTQKIERKHLTFRTRLKRLARKTICLSKSLHMHKIMIGLLINVLEFGCVLFLQSNNLKKKDKCDIVEQLEKPYMKYSKKA